MEHGEVEGRGSGRSAWTGRVSCEPGYTRLGPGHLKCRDGAFKYLVHTCLTHICTIPSGQWSGDIPVCLVMEGCEDGDLVDIQNGWRTAYRSFQDIIFNMNFSQPPTSHRRTRYRGGVWSYHCHRGWTRTGPELVWCESGNWRYGEQREVPRCVSECLGQDNDSTQHCHSYPQRLDVTRPLWTDSRRWS